MSVSIRNEIFQKGILVIISYQPCEFSILNVKSVFPGMESMSYLSPERIVPSDLKKLNSLSAFKQAIKKLL